MALRYQIFYRHHVKLQLHLPTPVCAYFTIVLFLSGSFVNSSIICRSTQLLMLVIIQKLLHKFHLISRLSPYHGWISSIYSLFTSGKRHNNYIANLVAKNTIFDRGTQLIAHDLYNKNTEQLEFLTSLYTVSRSLSINMHCRSPPLLNLLSSRFQKNGGLFYEKTIF